MSYRRRIAALEASVIDFGRLGESVRDRARAILERLAELRRMTDAPSPPIPDAVAIDLHDRLRMAEGLEPNNTVP